MTGTSKFLTTMFARLVIAAMPSALIAQAVTIVGSAHLHQLPTRPTAEQVAPAVDALAAFEPTQVCVETMSGERVETLAANPERFGGLLQSLARAAVQVGQTQQRSLGVRPGDARERAQGLLVRWDDLASEDRARLIALQLAGFEFASAVLNWSYLDDRERESAAAVLGRESVEELGRALSNGSEAYALAVPLGRKFGLHELCGADALEDESRGIASARAYGSSVIFAQPAFRSRVEQLVREMANAWRPDGGPHALVDLLRYYNGDAFADLDRKLEWETMHEFDNDGGAMTRRLMFWHARTAEISAELFRALARGPRERVLFIVGASHRPFAESLLRSQPWVEVVPVASWLNAGRR
jgi:hypothetical protein